ncbi:MAG: 7-cyano-7-deazaguanine synthase QueC [Planctomycetota bacterium]
MTVDRNALVLLSGGVDSTTVLAMAREQGFNCAAMSFDYGQRHRVELDAAARVAAAFDVTNHVTVTIDLRAFGGSALTADIDVPKDRDSAHIADEIPITYVPARNTIFLSFALGFAEVHGIRDLFIGVNAVDYSGYPDCRPEYIAAYERMANLATKIGVEADDAARIRIHTPLADLSKAEIIARGRDLGVDYALTHSCYDPVDAGRACGHCDSCMLRQAGFEAIGLTDPALS